jgi:hypothetical protein
MTVSIHLVEEKQYKTASVTRSLVTICLSLLEKLKLIAAARCPGEEHAFIFSENSRNYCHIECLDTCMEY